MKKYFLVFAIFATACNNQNPMAPSATHAADDSVVQEIHYIPLHHNIPATFVGHAEGPVIYLCATQPRFYEGRSTEDHYLQYDPCPETPVK